MSRSVSFRSFFVIWSGQAVSMLGSRLVQFALIWYLTERTGSATVLALASLIGLLPQVILGPFAGVLVDRWPRRAVMLAADSVVALATFTLGVLFWLGQAEIWHIFLLMFIRALAGSFQWPAMAAATALMVPDKHLTRVQGLNQTLNGGLSIVAAPLGALLLAVLPMQGIIALDVVTALFAIVPLLFIVIPEPEKQVDAAAEAASFFSELGSGLRYVRAWRGLMLLIGMAALVNLLLHPALSLLPILVTDHFGGEALQLGWLEAAAGIGIVVGGLLLGIWGGFEKRILTSLTGIIGLGLSVLLLSLTPASLFPVAVIALFTVGLTIALTDGPLAAIIQSAVAPEMQGRVFTLLGSAAKLMAPLGLAIAGPMSDLLGVRIWFAAAGGLTLIVGGASIFSSALMNIEAQETAPTVASIGGSGRKTGADPASQPVT